MWRWSAVVLAPLSYFATSQLLAANVTGTTAFENLTNQYLPILSGFLVLVILIVVMFR
jgi:hypothetical protein